MTTLCCLADGAEPWSPEGPLNLHLIFPELLPQLDFHQIHVVSGASPASFLCMELSVLRTDTNSVLPQPGPGTQRSQGEASGTSRLKSQLLIVLCLQGLPSFKREELELGREKGYCQVC